MSDKNLAVIGLAVVAYLYMKRRTATTVALAGSASAPVPMQSVPSPMWSKVYGNTWTDALRATGTVMQLIGRNPYNGQTVTSDGKPLTDDYYDADPQTYGQEYGPGPDSALMGSYYA